MNKVLEQCIKANITDHVLNGEDRFEYLADLLCDMKYFDKEEVSNIIKSHFNLWKSSELDKDISGSDIASRRSFIVSRQEEVKIQRYTIEQQLLIAKSKLKKGEKVDTEWMAKANYAYRMKGVELQQFMLQLSNLKTLEKERNMSIAQSEDRRVKNKCREFIVDKYGEDFYIDLIS